MNQPKERPILYSAPMVRAKLAGIKTQTRRILKGGGEAQFLGAKGDDKNDPRWWGWQSAADDSEFCSLLPNLAIDSHARCPYGKAGDRLWGREAQHILDMRPGITLNPKPVKPTKPCPVAVTYAADDSVQRFYIEPDQWRESFDNDHSRSRPSIHMPRWASRILDEIVEIRVERAQDISEADAIAEGVTETFDSAGGCHERTTAKENYAALWNSINGAGSWESNPWVWVIVTKPVKAGANNG